jgi:hypothetical protein
MRLLKMATLLVSAAVLCVCTSARAQSDLEDVAKVKDYYADWLSSIPGVTDVGVGEQSAGGPEIELHADVVTEQMRQLPHELNGFPVRIIKNPRNADDPVTPPDAQASGNDDEASTPAGDDSSAPAAGQAADASAPAAGQAADASAPATGEAGDTYAPAPAEAAPSAGEPLDPWFNPDTSQPKSVARPPGMP